jgi:hypothetical protein
MKYRMLKKGEIKKRGDQIRGFGAKEWTNLDIEIGTPMSDFDLMAWEYRRPLNRRKKGGAR